MQCSSREQVTDHVLQLLIVICGRCVGHEAAVNNLACVVGHVLYPPPLFFVNDEL